MMRLELMKLIVCLLFSLCANVTDWKEYRIPNWMVISFLLAGLCVNGLLGGVQGLLSSLGGAAVMLCLVPLFALRMLGAGDIKALMAIGALLGLPAAPCALVYSLLGAGAVAAFVVVLRKNGAARLREFVAYCVSSCLYGKFRPYDGALDAGGRFRFSFGITLGIAAMLARQLW